MDGGVGHLSNLCVPGGKTQIVCSHYHSFGHPGGVKLASIVRMRCEFEISRKEVLNTCLKVAKSCHVCQAAKPASGAKQPGTMDFWPIPEDVFQSLAMDFLSLLERVSDGQAYDSCLVVVCRMSG